MLTEFYSSRSAAESDRLMGRHEGGRHQRPVTSVPNAQANSGVTLPGTAVWLFAVFPGFRRAQGSIDAEILEHVESAGADLGRHWGKPW